MKIQIETNYLYYLSGVKNSIRLDMDKVNTELSKHELLLSIWSIYELITTTNLTFEEKKIVVNYIIDNNIGIIPFFMDGKYYDLSKLFIEYVNQITDYDSSKYEDFVNYVLNDKKDTEEKIIIFYTNLITTFTYQLFYNKMVNAHLNTAKLKAFEFCTTTLLESNLDKILTDSEQIINTHYLEYKDAITRKDITTMCYTFMFLVSVIFDKIYEGKITELYPNIFDYIEDIDLLCQNDGKTNFSKEFIKLVNKFSDPSKKFNYTKVFTDSEIAVVEDYLFNIFKNQMGTGTLKYLLIHIVKVLKERKSFNKNDTLDSYMLNRIDDYYLLTDDDGSINIIKEFNKKNYDFIIQFHK